MKYALVIFLAASFCTFAQDTVKTNVLYQTSGTGVVTAGAMRAFGAAVHGAPYSATITNESVQTLADGNRIIQNNSGTTARDSEGRSAERTQWILYGVGAGGLIAGAALYYLGGRAHAPAVAVTPRGGGGLLAWSHRW